MTKKGNDEKSYFEYQSEGVGDVNSKVLSKKLTENDDGTKIETTYDYKVEYGMNFLFHERETATDKDGNATITDTYHTSLGQGQRSSTVFRDGEYIGSAVGNTSGDDSATSYIQKNRIIFENKTESHTLTIEGNPLIDTSFPLVDDDDLIFVTNALKWLNRKIRETVTLEIYDFEHVIDFTDKIIFEGNEYFLQSNTVEKTERIVNKQTVNFVRWY